MANIEKFNKIADKYQSEQRITLYELFTDELQALNINGRLLDFGCGTGNLGINLASECEQVYLLDPSLEMRKIIKQKVEDNNLDNCIIYSQDLEQGEKLDTTFDVIIIAQVLLHIPNYQLLLSQLVEYLNSKGKLIIFDYKKNKSVSNSDVHNGFNVEGLIEYLQLEGLKYNFDKVIYSGENLLLGGYGEVFMLSMSKD